MTDVERKKGINKGLIVSLVIVVIILAANFPAIQSSYNKYGVQKTKKESTIIKTLTTEEIRRLVSENYKLAEKYDERKTEWLRNEIRNGTDTVYSKESYMFDHPIYDSAKMKLLVIKYKFDGKTVEFISNTELIQVHSESGWEDY